MTSRGSFGAASNPSVEKPARFGSYTIKPATEHMPAFVVFELLAPEDVAFPAVSMDGEHTGPNGEEVTSTSTMLTLTLTLGQAERLLAEGSQSPSDAAALGLAIEELAGEPESAPTSKPQPYGHS
jgi:hypothetical protein